MFAVQIDPARLEHLHFFGYTVSKRKNGYWFCSHPDLVLPWVFDPEAPTVLVDDINDAIQLGAMAINVNL